MPLWRQLSRARPNLTLTRSLARSPIPTHSLYAGSVVFATVVSERVPSEDAGAGDGGVPFNVEYRYVRFEGARAS